jgi:hypothetical protein
MSLLFACRRVARSPSIVLVNEVLSQTVSLSRVVAVAADPPEQYSRIVTSGAICFSFSLPKKVPYNNFFCCTRGCDVSAFRMPKGGSFRSNLITGLWQPSVHSDVAF